MFLIMQSVEAIHHRCVGEEAGQPTMKPGLAPMDVHEVDVVALHHPTQLAKTPRAEGREGDIEHWHAQVFELAEVGTVIGTSDAEEVFALELANQIVDVLRSPTNPLRNRLEYHRWRGITPS